MPYTDAAKLLMLDELGDNHVTHLSLHDDTPDSTGSNEITGGSYTRETVAFDPAASGEKAVDTAVVFDVPAGATVHSVGFWDGGSPPVFLGYDALDAPEAYAAAGTFTVTTATKLKISDPA